MSRVTVSLCPRVTAAAVNRTSSEIVPLEGNYYLVDQSNAAARAAIFDAFWQGYGQYGFKTVWLVRVSKLPCGSGRL